MKDKKLNCREKANYTERLHLDYLAENLNILPLVSNNGFDLRAGDVYFELKSRLSIHNRKGPMDNMWWALSDPQIREYESKHDPNKMFWIFIHALTSIPPPQLKTKKELSEDIYHRDVFIAPWHVYTPFRVGNACAHTKMGPYRILSKKRLFELIDFKEHALPKGKLYLPEGYGLESLIK